MRADTVPIEQASRPISLTVGPLPSSFLPSSGSTPGLMQEISASLSEQSSTKTGGACPRLLHRLDTRVCAHAFVYRENTRYTACHYVCCHLSQRQTCVNTQFSSIDTRAWCTGCRLPRTPSHISWSTACLSGLPVSDLPFSHLLGPAAPAIAPAKPSSPHKLPSGPPTSARSRLETAAILQPSRGDAGRTGSRGAAPGSAHARAVTTGGFSSARECWAEWGDEGEEVSCWASEVSSPMPIGPAPAFGGNCLVKVAQGAQGAHDEAQLASYVSKQMCQSARCRTAQRAPGAAPDLKRRASAQGLTHAVSNSKVLGPNAAAGVGSVGACVQLPRGILKGGLAELAIDDAAPDCSSSSTAAAGPSGRVAVDTHEDSKPAESTQALQAGSDTLYPVPQPERRASSDACAPRAAWCDRTGGAGAASHVRSPTRDSYSPATSTAARDDPSLPSGLGSAQQHAVQLPADCNEVPQHSTDAALPFYDPVQAQHWLELNRQGSSTAATPASPPSTSHVNLSPLTGAPCSTKGPIATVAAPAPDAYATLEASSTANANLMAELSGYGTARSGTSTRQACATTPLPHPVLPAANYYNASSLALRTQPPVAATALDATLRNAAHRESAAAPAPQRQRAHSSGDAQTRERSRRDRPATPLARLHSIQSRTLVPARLDVACAVQRLSAAEHTPVQQALMAPLNRTGAPGVGTQQGHWNNAGFVGPGDGASALATTISLRAAAAALVTVDQAPTTSPLDRLQRLVSASQVRAATPGWTHGPQVREAAVPQWTHGRKAPASARAPQLVAPVPAPRPSSAFDACSTLLHRGRSFSSALEGSVVAVQGGAVRSDSSGSALQRLGGQSDKSSAIVAALVDAHHRRSGRQVTVNAGSVL